MRITFNVNGMTCAACSARVEKVSSQVKGVRKAEVNLLAGTMVAELDNLEVADSVIHAVRNAGYDASLPGNKSAEPIQDDALKNMKTRNAPCSSFSL